MNNKSSGLFLVSIAVIAFSVLSGAGLSALTGGQPVDGEGPPYASVAQICTGRIPGAGEAPSSAGENEFYFMINGEVTFEKSTGVGNIMLENTVGNSCNIRLELTTEDGSLIYTSPTLLPNQYILSDRLTDPPQPGKYLATATITAYRPESGEVLGVKVTTVNMTINK